MIGLHLSYIFSDHRKKFTKTGLFATDEFLASRHEQYYHSIGTFPFPLPPLDDIETHLDYLSTPRRHPPFRLVVTIPLALLPDRTGLRTLLVSSGEASAESELLSRSPLGKASERWLGVGTRYCLLRGLLPPESESDGPHRLRERPRPGPARPLPTSLSGRVCWLEMHEISVRDKSVRCCASERAQMRSRSRARSSGLRRLPRFNPSGGLLLMLRPVDVLRGALSPQSRWLNVRRCRE